MRDSPRRWYVISPRRAPFFSRKKTPWLSRSSCWTVSLLLLWLMLKFYAREGRRSSAGINNAGAAQVGAGAILLSEVSAGTAAPEIAALSMNRCRCRGWCGDEMSGGRQHGKIGGARFGRCAGRDSFVPLTQPALEEYGDHQQQAAAEDQLPVPRPAHQKEHSGCGTGHVAQRSNERRMHTPACTHHYMHGEETQRHCDSDRRDEMVAIAGPGKQPTMRTPWHEDDESVEHAIMRWTPPLPGSGHQRGNGEHRAEAGCRQRIHAAAEDVRIDERDCQRQSRCSERGEQRIQQPPASQQQRRREHRDTDRIAGIHPAKDLH